MIVFQALIDNRFCVWEIIRKNSCCLLPSVFLRQLDTACRHVRRIEARYRATGEWDTGKWDCRNASDYPCWLGTETVSAMTLYGLSSILITLRHEKPLANQEIILHPCFDRSLEALQVISTLLPWEAARLRSEPDKKRLLGSLHGRGLYRY